MVQQAQLQSGRPCVNKERQCLLYAWLDALLRHCNKFYYAFTRKQLHADGVKRSSQA